jgi:hypothetical protein
VIVVYHTIDRGFNLAGVIIEMIRYIINTININPVCKSRSSHQYCSVFGVSCFDIVDISIQKCYTGAMCAMYCVLVWEGFIFRTPRGLMFPDHCHSGDWCHVKRVNRVVYSFFAADSSPFNTLSMSRMAAAQSLLGPSLFSPHLHHTNGSGTVIMLLPPGCASPPQSPTTSPITGRTYRVPDADPSDEAEDILTQPVPHFT